MSKLKKVNPEKEFKDIINKIIDGLPKEQDKYNGKTNFESNSKETSLAESQMHNTNPTAPSFGSRTKNEDIIEDKEGNKLDHWLYYDAEEDEWGDAYYYIIKTKDGRENYEYAYSMLNGKKKVYDRLNGSRGQVIIVPENYKVPADIQKWADDRFITIIHMPDSEFEYEMKDYGVDGEVFTDPYEKLEYLNNFENKENTQREIEQIRQKMLMQPVSKIDLNKDSNFIDNLNRTIENNENNISEEKLALQKSISILNNYDTNYNGKGASEAENEEIDYIDYSLMYLDVENVLLYSHIGYESELVVVNVNNINRILKRKEAYNLIDDIFKEKYKILKDATTKKEAKIANAMDVYIPSSREFALVKYCSEKNQDFLKKYKEKIKEMEK